jgi:23S rRNA (uracil1939-C5)-methyltransferase
MSNCVVVLDPPRRGLERTVVQHLCEAGPEHLLYLSCAPDILRRDLRPLLEGGYRVGTCTLFDMFARTAVFETLTILHRDAKKG